MKDVVVHPEQGEAEEQLLQQARRAKSEARDAQLARAREQAEARRRDVGGQVAASIRASPVQALPCLDAFILSARSRLNKVSDEGGQLASEGTELAIFAHLLETV